MDGQLMVDVISGLDLPGRDLYVKIEHGELIKKTGVALNKKGSLTEFNHKMVFNIADIREHAHLKVTLMERNTFFADEWLGETRVAVMHLEHSRSLTGDFNISKDGKNRPLQLGVRWLARDVEQQQRRSLAFGPSKTPKKAKDDKRVVSSVDISGAMVSRMTVGHRENQHLNAKKQALMDASQDQTKTLSRWMRCLAGSKDHFVFNSLAAQKKRALDTTLHQEKNIEDFDVSLEKINKLMYDTETATGSLSVRLLELPALLRSFHTYGDMPLGDVQRK